MSRRLPIAKWFAIPEASPVTPIVRWLDLPSFCVVWNNGSQPHLLGRKRRNPLDAGPDAVDSTPNTFRSMAGRPSWHVSLIAIVRGRCVARG